MDTPSNPKGPLAQRSPTVRFALWLIKPKTLGRMLCVLVTLATLIALYSAEETWRGRAAWERYRTAQPTQGATLDWEAYIPPPVAADKNFALTPYLAPLFDFLPGTQTWRDTNAYGKIEEINRSPQKRAKTLGFDLGAGKYGCWEIGKRTDLAALLGTNTTSHPDQHTASAQAGPPVHETELAGRLAGVTNSVTRPATQEQAAVIVLDLLKSTFDPVFQELRAASERPSSRFNIQYDYAPLPGILLPHLAKLKGVVLKLSWQASAELVLGQTNAAFDNLMLGLYLSDTVQKEPFLISQLVRLAERGILTQVIWDGMSRHQWSAVQLQQLQSRLANDNFCKEMHWVLLAERAGGVRIAEQLRTHAGGLNLSNLGDSDSQQSPLSWLWPNGWIYFEQLNLCRGYDRFLTPIDDWLNGRMDAGGLQTALDEVEKLCASRRAWSAFLEHRYLEGLLLPAVSRAFSRGLYAQARNDLICTACALERYFLAYHSYPEKLVVLAPQFIAQLPVDIMSRKPLIYRRESPQAYLLYSVGDNLKDDNGKVVFNKVGDVNLDEGDWVWRQPDK